MNWLDQLKALRDESEAAEKTAEQTPGPTVLSEQEKATLALKDSQAHKLLRRVQSVLLGGKGLIDIFDRTNEFDQAIALVWQGPIAKARVPRPDDPAKQQYIIVGAKGENLYVNGKRLKLNTPEALKPALVTAAKKPLTQSRPKEKNKSCKFFTHGG